MLSKFEEFPICLNYIFLVFLKSSWLLFSFAWYSHSRTCLAHLSSLPLLIITWMFRIPFCPRLTTHSFFENNFIPEEIFQQKLYKQHNQYTTFYLNPNSKSDPDPCHRSSTNIFHSLTNQNCGPFDQDSLFLSFSLGFLSFSWSAKSKFKFLTFSFKT